MNRKPERAIATLQKTRTAELSNELRDQRLLLEARALSETGRHDLALELIANIDSHEAIRLRSDILWSAKRWRAAAEQIEMLYGERWKDFTPLTEPERFDILRAAIGYSLGDEPLGLARFRERYAPKMVEHAGRPRLRRGQRAGRHRQRRNSRTSPRRSPASIRWRRSCATCARAIRIPRRSRARRAARGRRRRAPLPSGGQARRGCARRRAAQPPARRRRRKPTARRPGRLRGELRASAKRTQHVTGQVIPFARNAARRYVP